MVNIYPTDRQMDGQIDRQIRLDQISFRLDQITVDQIRVDRNIDRLDQIKLDQIRLERLDQIRLDRQKYRKKYQIRLDEMRLDWIIYMYYIIYMYL